LKAASTFGAAFFCQRRCYANPWVAPARPRAVLLPKYGAFGQDQLLGNLRPYRQLATHLVMLGSNETD
jgi:hypothetical protein